MVLLERILLIAFFLGFLYFMEDIGLGELKLFTIICICLIGLDILLNLFILYMRLRGLCRPGMKYPYARMNEDYVELQGGTRNLSNWLAPPVDEGLFESTGVNHKMASNYKRSNRTSYRSNIVSEIHSIPAGSQYGQPTRSRRSGFTKDNSRKFNNW